MSLTRQSRFVPLGAGVDLDGTGGSNPPSSSEEISCEPDDRLDKIADNFVDHCATRWEAGKSMLVCVDKITCARMYQRIVPRWQSKISAVRAEIAATDAALSAATDPETRQILYADLSG